MNEGEPTPAAAATSPRAWDAAVTRAPLVSVFTATHEIGAEIDTAFRSLLRQTYANWEWVIVDDSQGTATADHIALLVESGAAAGRIRFFRQLPPPGSVGATKAAAGMLCRGQVMVEFDHDDELTPEALEIVAATFLVHPEIDFAYSDWVDWLEDPQTGGRPALYPAGWGFGFGAYASEVVGDRRVPVALAPPINQQTVRHIVSMPNHLRAWRTAFYRRVGGHDYRLTVADDYELLLRTFIKGTMAHIPRALYIQHHRGEDSNTSRSHNADIQRLVGDLAAQRGSEIDDRCRALGLTPAAAAPPLARIPPPAASARIDVISEAADDLGMPLVSVVIPTYRRPEHLKQAVASALGQTYSHIEVLVVGDACPLLDTAIASIDDHRLRSWNLDANRGDLGSSARNYALQNMARGTLVAYLDDDNWWEPNHLESLIAALTSIPGAAYAFSSFEVDGEVVVSRRPRRYQIDTSTLLHRRDLLERYGYWRSGSEHVQAHDWELVSRWHDERWAATLQPTLHYRLETSHQNRRFVEFILSVAEEERRLAGG